MNWHSVCDLVDDAHLVPIYVNLSRRSAMYFYSNELHPKQKAVYMFIFVKWVWYSYSFNMNTYIPFKTAFFGRTVFRDTIKFNIAHSLHMWPFSWTKSKLQTHLFSVSVQRSFLTVLNLRKTTKAFKNADKILSKNKTSYVYNLNNVKLFVLKLLL